MASEGRLQTLCGTVGGLLNTGDRNRYLYSLHISNFYALFLRLLIRQHVINWQANMGIEND